jgi:hypothetical protein
MYPSLTDANAEETGIPIYAQVDFSKKRKNRKQDDGPIYAVVDKSKKKVRV